MGTTDTALDTDNGVRYCFVLAIEGYPYLITDHSSMSAVTTAWSGSEWSSAIGGLHVDGGIKQQINPLSDDLDVPTLTFRIMDYDGNDTFGKDVWKSKPTYQTRLSAVFEPAAAGTGTLTVKDNTNFASSGTVYMGTRAISYSAKPTSKTFTVTAANAYRVFDADSTNVYNRPQGIADGNYLDSSAPTVVKDVYHGWIGRMVGLYIHRIVGDTLDTRAQARVEFAGTISKIEDGDAGFTVVHCRDMRGRISDAVLLKDQWEGKIAESGYYLRDGTNFYISHLQFGGSNTYAGALSVVTGASGSDQLEPGTYTAREIAGKISEWLRADGSVSGFECEVGSVEGVSGPRFSIRARFSTSAARTVRFFCTDEDVFTFLGFSQAPWRWAGDTGTVPRGTPYVVGNSNTGNELGLVAQWPPKRFQYTFNGTTATISLDSSTGTFHDLTDYLPEPFKTVAGSDNYSFFELNGMLLFGKYASATQLTNVEVPAGLHGLMRMGVDPMTKAFSAEDSEEEVKIRQVGVLSGKVSSLLPALFLSIDGRGVNSSTHDVLPFGAALPWELADDTFIDSCEALEQQTDSGSMTIVLRKPTMLRDVLLPELLLRFSFLIFKDGVYQFVSPPVPNATTADHTLDETNKATPGGEDTLSTQEWTTDHMVNVIKVNYEKNVLGDKFNRSLVVRDTTSIDAYGEQQAMEVDAVNSFLGSRTSVTGVEELATVLSTRLLPMWGRPMKIVTRTIAPTLYNMAPGDTVSLSDDLLRDPTSGARGISSRGCIVLSVFHDYGTGGGQMRGEVTLLLSDENRTFKLSPATEIDCTYTSGSYSTGYDSTNFRLKCVDNQFSKSGDSKDCSNFAAGDLIRILEADPADPSAPTAWDRTISSVDTSTGYIELTAALSSPSWSAASTDRFIIIPQEYSACQSSQLTGSFQADDADALIEDTADPNVFGDDKVVLDFAAGTATTAPVLIPQEMYGDGIPITPAHGELLADMVNNLISYKCTTHLPDVTSGGRTNNQTEWELVDQFPLFVGGSQSSTGSRVVRVGPMFRSENAAATASVRVTLSGTPSASTSYPISFVSPYLQNTWTTTSTTYTQGTEYDFTLIDAAWHGYVWVTVEAKSSSTSYSCRFKGLTKLHIFGGG